MSGVLDALLTDTSGTLALAASKMATSSISTAMAASAGHRPWRSESFHAAAATSAQLPAAAATTPFQHGSARATSPAEKEEEQNLCRSVCEFGSIGQSMAAVGELNVFLQNLHCQTSDADARRALAVAVAGYAPSQSDDTKAKRINGVGAGGDEEEWSDSDGDDVVVDDDHGDVSPLSSWPRHRR